MDKTLTARLQQQRQARVRAGIKRREFLAGGAGAGLAFGLPPWLAACGGGDDDERPPARPTHERTLFFNLSHEQHVGRTYYLTGGGRRHVLTSVADQPHVLRRERESNAFLRGVPDDQITHHVESASFASDTPTLCYVSSDIDAQAGTWSMSSVQLYIPPAGAARAFAEARKHAPSGALPMSAKRSRYGVRPAASEQDLRDERVLLDTVSHAATLVGCYPDLMSVDVGSAHIVHSNHVDPRIEVTLLGRKLAEPQYGPAQPQQSDQPNTVGWATLQPVPGDTPGVPLKNTKGQHAGRIQYQPSVHPDLRPLMHAATAAAMPRVKDDVALGADVTGLTPGAADGLNGALWLRHDGLTKVDQSPGAGSAAIGDATMVLKQQNPQAFYWLKDYDASKDGDAIKVSLTVLNFYLQFRGIWLQFLDGDTVLNLTDIPEYNAGTIFAGHSDLFDTAQEMFVGVIGPVFTVFAIPTVPGYVQPSFHVPAKATSVRILSSTLSFQGGNAYPQTVLPGAIMTALFNYAATILLAAAGAGNLIPAMYKEIVVPYLQGITLEVVAIISSGLNPNLTAAGFFEAASLALGKLLVSWGTSVPNVAKLVGFISGAITEGAAEDSVPIAGAVLAAISVAIGAANVLETEVELAVAPWTFVDDLVFTHKLSVTLTPDSTVPQAATRYTVTAMFDDGTPHVQTFPLNAPVPSLPPVVFSNVPFGGFVKVSVAFVQEAIFPGMPDILLGKGTTDLLANTVDSIDLHFEQVAFPISSNTIYQHRQKTSLDENGNHRWVAAPAPTANAGNSTCGGAGTICGFRDISVRQATGATRGYLGYAWQSQNSDPSRAPSCRGGGTAQLDQIANLNTDSGNDGANAQLGYLNSSCGITQPGVRVAYSLLSHGTANFYLDTTDPNVPVVRQVTLEPQPSFESPSSGEVWGVLNMPSDRLLLHPAGHLVSISVVNHKLETLRLPKKPMAIADAKVHLLAQPKSGRGARPGLMDSPVTAAVSADGVILVLEAGNNRIQAFDLGGNPVRHFNKQTGPNASPYSLTLGGTDPAQWAYLDLAVEYTGYLYVLAYNQNTFDYRLDLYHPNQSDSNPISTTTGINAARIAVDLWRSVYTLNYEVLQLPGGAAPLTEPSVSLWTPCNRGQTC